MKRKGTVSAHYWVWYSLKSDQIFVSRLIGWDYVDKGQKYFTFLALSQGTSMLLGPL